jgi:hypothetical protein
MIGSRPGAGLPTGCAIARRGRIGPWSISDRPSNPLEPHVVFWPARFFGFLVDVMIVSHPGILGDFDPLTRISIKPAKSLARRRDPSVHRLFIES